MSAVTLFQDKQGHVQHPSVIHYAKLKRQGVIVSGHEDTFFIAIAVGFIDLILHKQLIQAARNPLLLIVLSLYREFFPQKESSSYGLKTPFERTATLIDRNRENIFILINKLSFVFRQMAVDEIAANPEQYRGLLQSVEDAIDLKRYRKPGVSLGQTAAVAMAKVLNMPIRIRETELDKKVFNCLKYNEAKLNMLNPGIELSLEARKQQYTVKVVKYNLFSRLMEVPNPIDDVTVTKALARPLPHHDKIAETLNRQDKILKQKYRNTVKKLQQALAEESIDRQQLIDFYIKNLGTVNADAVSKEYLKQTFDQYYFES